MFVVIFLLEVLVLAASDQVLEKKIIACVGDSITAGAGASDKKITSYPGQLKLFLNNVEAAERKYDYEVFNYGKGGTTALKTSRKTSSGVGGPYWETKQYKDALLSNPDIAVIMFGSNDSKESDWNEDRFVSDYLDLVASFKKLPSSPIIYICIPTPLYGRPSFQLDVINRQLPLIIKKIGETADVEVISVFDALGGVGLTRPHMFIDPKKVIAWPNDGLHPNDHGYRKIARTVAKAISGSDINEALRESDDVGENTKTFMMKKLKIIA